MITEAHVVALVAQLKLLTIEFKRVADALEHANVLYCVEHDIVIEEEDDE